MFVISSKTNMLYEIIITKNKHVVFVYLLILSKNPHILNLNIYIPGASPISKSQLKPI